MSLEEQLRNDAQSLRELGWFNRAMMMTAAADEIHRLNGRINEMEEIIPILMRGIDRTLKGSADRYFSAYRKAEQLLKLNAHEDRNTNASYRASGAVHRHSV